MQKLKSIGLEEARVIGEAVLEACAKPTPDPRPMSVAVVDNAGELIYLARMDGAGPGTVRMAINKACTAVSMKRDTIEILKWISGEIIEGVRRDVAWFGNPTMAPVPGGVVLKSSDGSVVGAVGTSGRVAMAPLGDEELARIGAAAFKEGEE